MIRLKTYESFVDTMVEPELSTTTIDDVLKDDFFNEDTYVDSMGIINIKGWTVY